MAVGEPGCGIDDLLIARILEGDVGREPVLRKADPAIAKVGADLGVLGGIEPVLVEQLVERRARGLVRALAREHDIEEGLDHPAQFGLGATGGREQVEFGAADGSKGAPVLTKQGRGDQGVVRGGHERRGVFEQIGAGALFIDGEVVDDRVHGEGEGVLEITFGSRHDLLELFPGLGHAMRGHDEAHAAAGHSTEHPEAPEILAELGARAVDEGFGVEIRGPGDDGLDRAMEVAGGGGADGGDVRGAKGAEDFVEHAEGLLSSLPFVGRPEEVFFGDHLEDGSDVLSHATMDEDQAFLEGAAGFGRGILVIEDAVLGHEPAAADAEFGVVLRGEDTGNEFHAGPDASAILPATARTAEPFAQDRAGKDESTLAFLECTGEGGRLTGGAHADRDERSEEAGGDGEARAFGDIVDARDELEAASGAGDLGEQFGQALAAAFDARGDDAAGDDGGFEQAEIILGEIEHFGELSDFGGGTEVDAGQAEDGVIDDAEEGFDGRTGRGIAAMDGEIDGDVEDASALRVIHAEEEDVAPAAVAEVHAHRGAFAEDGIETSRVAPEQLGSDAEWLIEGMSHPEHPLIAADGADAASDLVGQGLEGEAMVGGREGARDAVAGSVVGLVSEEGGDGFVEPTAEEMVVAGERDETAGVQFRAAWQVKAVEGVQEEEGADTFVEIGGVMPESLEGIALGEQLGERSLAAKMFEGLIADRGVGAGYDRYEGGGHGEMGWVSVLGAQGQKFHQVRENFVAILSFEGEGELRGQEAVTHADVVATSCEGGSQITFAADELGEGGAELNGVVVGGGEFGQEIHDMRGQDMHAEEAKVVSGAEAGHVQVLLGLGGSRFFADLIHLVDPAVGASQSAADRSVVEEFAFVGGLDGGDGTILGGGDFDELLGASIGAVLDVEVVADEEQEGIVFGEIVSAQHGMTIAARRFLGDEMEPAGQVARAQAVGGFIAGPDDEADLVNAGFEDFLGQDAEGGFFDAVAVHERLEG